MSQEKSQLTRRAKQKKAWLLFGITGAALIWLNLITGSEGIVFGETFKLFDTSQENSMFTMIVSQIRLPRILAAILAGALLGLSGAIMQGALKNPLASPFTLGISQAAAFGASFAIIVLNIYTDESSLSASLSVSLFAFLASLLCMGVIILLAKIAQLSAASMILAGVGLGSLFGALTMFLQYFADDLQIAATLFWTFGELGKARWDALFIMAASLVLLVLFFAFNHWKMDALSFGDESAKSRGVDVGKFRLITLLLASFACALAVSFLGIIGFVGLVAPHLVRLIVGHNAKSILLFSTVTGALLLLFADLVAKLLLSPIILPIGIVTSFMGVPIFLYLLVRKGR